MSNRKKARKPQARKRVSHIKTGQAQVTLHLQPRTKRLTLTVVLPREISTILARRVDKRP